MTSKLNLLTAFLLLAIIITIKECQASSSTTISSRYTNNNFANPTSNNNYNNELDKYGIVNIVKSPTTSPSNSYGSDKEEEYVTSFYKRVRNKHRCNLFGKVLEECSSHHGGVNVRSGSIGGDRSESFGRSGMDEQQSVQSSGYDGIDHSLDHYFDHELRTSSSIPSSSSSAMHDDAQYGQQQQKSTYSANVELTPSSSSSSSRAQAVRGGGGGGRRMVQNPRTFVSKTIWAPPRSGRSHYRGKGSHAHRNTIDTSLDLDFDNDEYDSSSHLEDDIQDILDGVLDDNGDESCGRAVGGLDEHHHLGLLRVPCSIAVNSGEATQYASSHGTSLKSWVLNAHTTHIHFFLTLISQNS